MGIVRRKLASWAFGSGVALAVACGGSQPEPAAGPSDPRKKDDAPAALPVAVEATRVLPQLRTGDVPPETMSEPIPGKLVGYVRTAETETFKVELPRAALDGYNEEPWVIFGTEPGPLSVLAFGHLVQGPGVQNDVVWLRRRLGSAPSDSLEATILSKSYGSARSRANRVRVSLAGAPASNPKLTKEYYGAVAAYLQGSLLAPLLDEFAAPNTSVAQSYGYTEWASVMRLTTGYDSIEAALQANAKLRASADPKRASVPIANLKPPAIDSHPWPTMLAALPNVEVAPEPLAELTPKDFYFVRAKSYDALQRLLDEADVWVTAGVRLSEGSGRRHELVERYRAQLGLTSSELTRWLGPKLVRDLALVGSDAFVRQGSDVTLVVRPIDATGFANALTAKLATDHPGGVKRETFAHQGVTVTRNSTPDGALNQFVAHLPSAKNVGAVSLVSNSKGAITRVLDVALSKSAALTAEPDFGYMLKRDAAVPADILCFMGDAFVRTSVGPEQRILDARRQLARAELSRTAYGALLFAWLEGREPKNLDELTKSPWLPRRALTHTAGGNIQFQLGDAPTSSWGTPAFLTPLIDLPRPVRVTQDEEQAYASFAQSYLWSWSEHVDPIAMRFQVVREQGMSRLASHVRVLPVVNTNDYREVWRFAGATHLATTPPLPGLHFTLGIAPDSEIRQALSGQGRSFLGKEFKVDWLGDWVTLGVADEPALGRVMQLARKAPEPREVEVEEKERVSEAALLSQLPVFLALDIKNTGAAALAITLLRQAAQQAVPDVLSWGEHGKQGETTVMRVAFDDIVLYYALTKRRFFLSLDEALLRGLVMAEQEGRGIRVHNDPKASTGGQLAIDLERRDPSGLLQAFAWLVESELRERLNRDARSAEVLLRGTPGRSAEVRRGLANDYLGFLPVTPDGVEFTLDPSGIKDPARGTTHHPIYPDLPVKGSPLEALIAALSKLHVELAFDEEPGAGDQRSLRTAFTLSRPE